MKDMFSSYYRPSEDDFKALWEQGVFILDANVLLNLYRYPQHVRDDLLGIFEKIADRLWIPHQVVLEYQENRLAVISEQLTTFGKVREALTTHSEGLKNDLGKLQLKRRHSSIDPDELLEKIDAAIEAYREKLAQLEKEQLDVHTPDPIRDRLADLLAGKIGPAPESQEALDEVYVEGEKRYAEQIPPGYEDARIKGERLLRHQNLTYQTQYGDLLLWKQLLAEANEKGWSHVIFVTDDAKEDWWWVQSGKTIGPRRELVEEITANAGVSLFHMYGSERFMGYAKQYLGVEVAQDSIDVVRETKDTSYVPTPWRVREIFQGWLKRQFPQDNIAPHFRRHITGVVREDHKTGQKIGYDIRLVRKETVHLSLHLLAIENNIRNQFSEAETIQLVLVFVASDVRVFSEGITASMVDVSEQHGVPVILGYLAGLDEERLEFVPFLRTDV